MEKNIYANRRLRKGSNSRFKKFKDEQGLQYLSKKIPLEEYSTLDEKLKLIEENFNLSDKEFNKYSTIKSKLNNGTLFLGEFKRYEKELKEIRKDMFDSFKKTWYDIVRHSKDISSDTLKKYQNKFDTYNVDLTRNTFN
jgi:hypothetical protein